ncbi:MAG TPA: hypothetical protein VNN80_02585 [Polyangiaceae bacterium]|nr:hypothetical protein [Polyangiaceae bacterium]
MTTRKDIEPTKGGWRRLSYTCRCGWVDWGHALPGGPLGLRGQIDSEVADSSDLNQLNVTLNGAPAFIVRYGQSMGSAVRVSNMRQWAVRQGLTTADRRSVALAIYLSASFEFERMQGRWPFSMASGGSSFSAEDLISNLVGFYGAFDGIEAARLRQVCGEVTVAASYRLWDKYSPGGLGAHRNEGLTPVRFPCSECDGTQSDTSFPSRFSSIQPAPPGVLWARVKGQYIDLFITSARRTIDVSSSGELSARRVH